MKKEYTKSEYFIAKILSKFPVIKIFIKRGYQIINFYKSNNREAFSTNSNIEKIDERVGYESFFGYYDKSPINLDKKFIIFHSSLHPTYKKPVFDKPIQIVLKNNFDRTYKIVDYSSAYNWQQGSRLQWLNSNEFIYNFYDHERKSLISKVYNVYTKQFKSIDFPVYDCYKDSFALSLDFLLLSRFSPDYGYKIVKNGGSKSNIGLVYVDLLKGQVKNILGLKEIYSDIKNYVRYKHLINHIMISPDGTKAIFIHRYYNKFREKYDRLLLYDISSGQLNVLVDEGLVSHCNWHDKSNIIGYLRYNYKNSFYNININTKQITLLSENIKDFPDGHPTSLKDCVIFDSYPDKTMFQNLYKLDLKKDTVEVLGRFRHPLKYHGESRCDLHPRLGSDNVIYFDSVCENKRFFYKM